MDILFNVVHLLTTSNHINFLLTLTWHDWLKFFDCWVDVTGALIDVWCEISTELRIWKWSLRSEIMCRWWRTHWWWWRHWWSRSNRQRSERADGRGTAPSLPHSAGRHNACTASWIQHIIDKTGQVKTQEKVSMYHQLLKINCPQEKNVCQSDTDDLSSKERHNVEFGSDGQKKLLFPQFTFIPSINIAQWLP